MLSDFQRKKILHLFILYDVNQDGEVGLVDFELSANKLADAFDLDAASEQAEAIRTSYSDYWAYLQRYMDRNMDKTISVTEFVERYEFLSRQPESIESLIFSTTEYLVALTDLDGDGIINRTEYIAYLMAHNVSREDANAAFELNDSNVSDTLTRDELLHSVRVFLTSNDPKMPGNNLFGLVGSG